MVSDCSQRFLGLFLFSILLFSLSVQAVDNPIHYDDAINDCDVIKYNGEYFLTGNWIGGDMFRSRNLEDWGERTHVFSYNSGNQWYTPDHPDDPDLDIHAGHIAYDNGVFHLYTQLGSYITHATSSNVMGPYVDQNLSSPFAERIDAEIFRDEDGSLHFFSTRFGGVSSNHNDYRPMSDYYTLTGSYQTKIWPNGGWEDVYINEGPKVFKYRGQYYMLYNANATGDVDYQFGCTQSSSVTGFSNSGKYGYPVVAVTTFNTGTEDKDIYTIGQPWVVDGLNGFEKWLGYFAIVDGEGRTQRIDRMHFLDRHLFVDGPTNRYTTGYHPGPAEPELRSLFHIPDGPMPATDWQLPSASGSWEVLDSQAYQSSQDCFSFAVANRKPAVNYLIEANVKMTAPRDSEDKAGVLAYYRDLDNWVIVGLDRSLGYGADNWYCHVRANGVDAVVGSGGYSGSLDYGVYHKIRVEKNGSTFRVWIDDMLPPNFSAISTNITEPGVGGLFSNHAPAVFDGVIYTIGWDEFDDRIEGWGDNTNGFAQVGNWSVATDGISMSHGTGYTFKGDFMNEYEFSTQIYKTNSTNGVMGVVAVAVDSDNYLTANFNLTTDQLIVGGVQGGAALAQQSVSVANKNDYNLRVIKLSDRVIFFIDGTQVLTYNVNFEASQVGLFVDGMSARFNGIMAFEIKDDSVPAQWINTDVGIVGFAGNASYNEGTFTINGSGADIWHLSDGFHYVYQDLYGDGTIVARVVSNDITDWWNKAGIMLRTGLAGNAGMVMLNYCGGGNIQLIWRNAPGFGTGIIDVTGAPHEAMVWLKLMRIGTSYLGYYSYDGQSWTYIGYCAPPLNTQDLKAGLCVTSHNNTRLNGAVFDNVSISGCTPGDLPTDLTRDCSVNIDDLVIFAEQWLGNSTMEANFDGNVRVDFGDFSILANDWLSSYDD